MIERHENRRSTYKNTLYPFISSLRKQIKKGKGNAWSELLSTPLKSEHQVRVKVIAVKVLKSDPVHFCTSSKS
jgi:hypothetical protein